jgi:hypothetical protein
MTDTLERITETTPRQVESFETAKGSKYTYLEDGRTQRFKRTDGTRKSPQSAIVFIPTYEIVQQIAPRKLIEQNVFGENELQYEQELLSYVQESGRSVYILDENGRKIESNDEIAQAESRGRVCLAFLKGKKTDFCIPVVSAPRVGFYPYDTTKSRSGNGFVRARHMGHKITKIQYRDES